MSISSVSMSSLPIQQTKAPQLSVAPLDADGDTDGDTAASDAASVKAPVADGIGQLFDSIA